MNARLGRLQDVQVAEDDLYEQLGGKAAPLVHLARAGLPVPAGFVIPTSLFREFTGAITPRDLAVVAAGPHPSSLLPPDIRRAIARSLEDLTGGGVDAPVAVRSSATNEDGSRFSAAGAYRTELGARGPDHVCDAVVRCWASLYGSRTSDTRFPAPGVDGAATAAEEPAMAVLIQLQLRPEVSGVLFTGETATIEANWGLGTSVVSGLVTPDSWTIENGVTSASLGSKHRRTDLHDDRMVTTSATDQERGTLCLTEAQVAQVLVLGREAEVVLGGPLDVEWCSVDGSMHLLQARPITAAPEVRRASARRSSHPNTLQGIPGSPGRATGRARVVRSPAGLADFRRGDVLVAEHTDPAWTPAFALASAVVTEHGGRLSHAAIVAREAGIPAVLSVPGATAACAAGRTLTVDGDGGRVTVHLRR